MHKLNFSRHKIAFIGEVYAGKTTLAHYVSYNEFKQNQTSTVGAAYYPLEFNKDKIFELWDTSGQEKYSSLTTLYYRNAAILLLVFDASNYRFEEKLKYYLDETRNKVTDIDDYKIIIVCNKIDLVDNDKLLEVKKRVNAIIETSDSKENIADYVEVSSKNKIGRQLLIDKINDINTQQISDRIKREQEYLIDLDKINNFEEKSCCMLS